MDSDTNIEYAESIVKNDMTGKNAVVAQAIGTMACAHALIAIAKELRDIRKKPSSPLNDWAIGFADE